MILTGLENQVERSGRTGTDRAWDEARASLATVSLISPLILRVANLDIVRRLLGAVDERREAIRTVTVSSLAQPGVVVMLRRSTQIDVDIIDHATR